MEDGDRREITIPGRFNGPPASANGGYACGTVARLLGEDTVEVRLRRPVPLDQPLRWDGSRLLDGDGVVAEGRSFDAADLPVTIPEPVSPDAARAAAERYPGFHEHPYPTCFGCGPQRPEGDGLRLFAGAVEGRDVVAAPWIPDASLLVEGKVPGEVVWAALDCTGGWSALAETEGTFVLGTMVGSVERAVAVGQQHVAVGWWIDAEGRKLRCGSALHTDRGELVGWTHQTWIRVT